MGAFGFLFRSFIFRERPISFGIFLIVKKKYFVCSQNDRSLSIYFGRFLNERSFSKVVRLIKSFLQYKNDSFF